MGLIKLVVRAAAPPRSYRTTPDPTMNPQMSKFSMVFVDLGGSDELLRNKLEVPFTRRTVLDIWRSFLVTSGRSAGPDTIGI